MQGPGAGGGRLRTGVAVALVAALVLVVMGAATSGPWNIVTRSWLAGNGVGNPGLPVFTPPVPSYTPLPLGPSHPLLAWLWVVPAVGVAVGVGLLLWRLLRHLRGRFERTADDSREGDPVAGDPVTEAAETMARGLAEARAALESNAEPRDAIVACWLALERAAGRTGVERDRAQTPTEFTTVVLKRTRADVAATSDLLRLYLAARFSDHPIGPKEMRRARVCVEGLNRSWPGWSDPDRRPNPSRSAR